MARSSIGTGYCPFKAVRWVRLPYGLLGFCDNYGRKEQLVARLPVTEKVAGSTPVTSAVNYVPVAQWIQSICLRSRGSLVRVQPGILNV